MRTEAKQQKVRRFSGALRAIGSIAAAFVVLAGCTAAFRATDTLYPAAPTADTAVRTITADDAPVTYARLGGAPVLEYETPMVYVASDGSADAIPVVTAEDSTATEELRTRGAEPIVPEPTLAPMLIRSVERTIATENFDGASQNIRDLTEQYGGYLAVDAATIAGNGLRTGDFTAVIPAVEADSFLQTIDHVGNVTYTAEHFEDASASVQDVQMRLDALKAEAGRINELLLQAASADELAQLSALLQANIAEVNALESESHRLNSDLNNVRISIHLTEMSTATFSPTAEPALGQLMTSAFSQSAGNFSSFVRDMAVTLMILAPYLLTAIIVILIVLAAVLLVLRIRRK